MNHYYQDILERIPEPPKWWDEHAVPRYCDFAPDQVANIYAREAVLLEIACQNCGKFFDVAMSWDEMQGHLRGEPSLRFCIEGKTFHYGDPPNARCCPAGPTMNCLDIRVKQYWLKESGSFNWQRVAALEIELPDAEEAEI